jgi:phage gpG-like protein
MQGIPGLRNAIRDVASFERHRASFNYLIYAKMVGQVRRTFESQTDPETGAPWKPVQPFGHGTDPSHKILQSNAGAGLIGALMAAPMVVEGDEVSIAPPDSVPYANIHQWGGTIVPRHAKNLALPMSREDALAGSAGRWWEQQKGKGNKPFIYRARTGKRNLFIALRGSDGKLELHWLLKKMVTIPQRRYFGWNDTYNNEIASVCMKRMAVIARTSGFDTRGADA